MEVTQRVMAVDGDSHVGRIVVCADERSLTPYAGLAVSGELARRLGLAGLIDAELSVERRARPVKARRRGPSAGAPVVSLAECQLVGGSLFDHVEDVGADRAGARLRAVAETPSASAALQNAKRFCRCHVQRIERAAARAGERLDRALGREAGAPVTVDLDATQVTVYGRHKRGAGRTRHGTVGYAPHVAFWAQRGRALTSELVAGNREKLSGADCARIARRAIGLLPAGHGPVTVRVDSASYAVELLAALRAERARFTVSAPRSTAMRKALARIPEDAWSEASDMPGAQVAETTYTPAGWSGGPLRLIVRRVCFGAAPIAALRGSRRLKTIHPDQLALALDGQLEHVHGYSLIVTDIDDRDARWIEHFHRHRAQIEERLKDAKLGQALRHLPSGDEHANRLWLTAALLALNLTAFCCDLCPAAGASGKAPDHAPLRRAAHTLRRLLFCVPARIVHSARRTILRLPQGFRHTDTFTATLDAVYALPPP
jgi:Transposase DDE domain group 1